MNPKLRILHLTWGNDLPKASVALTCRMSQLWTFSLFEPNMVKTVLFSPGSVRSPYTNTGFSEKTNVFQVSPSFVLYLPNVNKRSLEVTVLEGRPQFLHVSLVTTTSTPLRGNDHPVMTEKGQLYDCARKAREC